MKIAIFTDSWLPRIDGLTTSVQALKSELERRGHSFHIFCSGRRSVREAGVTRYGGLPFWGYPDFRLSLNPWAHKTARILRDEGFDLVHIQSPFLVGWWGLRAGRKAGLPVVTSYHTHLPDLVPYVVPPGFRRPSRRIVWAWTGRFLRQCDKVLAPSANCANELLEHVQGHRLPGLEVHPNGVDARRFHPSHRSEAMRQRLSPGGGPVIISVGRLAREKDIPFLIDAFALARAEQPNLVLALGGKGPELERIQRRARSLGVEDGLNVLGFIADEDLGAAYASADAFATASQFETQGMTAVEAMASGTPVAAVRARGLADFVQDGRTGFLFEPGDVEGAARALLQAVAGGDHLRARARKHAETLTLARSTDQLETVYEDVVALHARRPAPPLVGDADVTA
jgi:1,2-diacylglycerol 3-alpha-glucosyltransferase